MTIISDVSGKPGARTYRVSFDAQEWVVDLTEEEAQPILDLIHHGKRTEVGSSVRSVGNRSLESRIRNAPDRPHER